MMLMHLIIDESLIMYRHKLNKHQQPQFTMRLCYTKRRVWNIVGILGKEKSQGSHISVLLPSQN